MGGEKSLNEALNQAVKLEAAKVAVRPPAKLSEVRAAALIRIRSPATERRRAGSVETSATSEETVKRDVMRPTTQDRVRAGENWGPPASSSSSPRFILSVLVKRTTT
jgi:hypothetical protein